jgi:hypothetical protein
MYEVVSVNPLNDVVCQAGVVRGEGETRPARQTMSQRYWNGVGSDRPGADIQGCGFGRHSPHPWNPLRDVNGSPGSRERVTG